MVCTWVLIVTRYLINLNVDLVDQLVVLRNDGEIIVVKKKLIGSHIMLIIADIFPKVHCLISYQIDRF